MSMKVTMAEFVGLEPCPFCGGEAECHAWWSATISGKYATFCTECGSGTDYYNTEAEAIEAWNTRAERTCHCTTDDSAWCFACSECGKTFPRSDLHFTHNHGEINYCPNCGRRVINNDN